MTAALESIAEVGIVPVVTIDEPEHAVPLARALAASGLGVVEITLRTPAGLEAIAAVDAHVPEATVGAGSVTRAEDAESAIDAGARFVVSPGFDEGVVLTGRSREVLTLPGVATATELMCAMRHGVEVVKLFPAESAGGVSLVSSLAAVWPDVRFVPTGGITPANAGAYLAHPSVLAIGGSWMVPRDLIAAGEWPAVERLAVEAVTMRAAST